MSYFLYYLIALCQLNNIHSSIQEPDCLVEAREDSSATTIWGWPEADKICKFSFCPVNSVESNFETILKEINVLNMWEQSRMCHTLVLQSYLFPTVFIFIKGFDILQTKWHVRYKRGCSVSILIPRTFQIVKITSFLEFLSITILMILRK